MILKLAMQSNFFFFNSEIPASHPKQFNQNLWVGRPGFYTILKVSQEETMWNQFENHQSRERANIFFG